MKEARKRKRIGEHAWRIDTFPGLRNCCLIGIDAKELKGVGRFRSVKYSCKPMANE